MDKEVVCGMKRFLGFYTKTVRDIFPDSLRTRIYCASKRIVLTLSKCTILGYVREIEFIFFFCILLSSCVEISPPSFLH